MLPMLCYCMLSMLPMLCYCMQWILPMLCYCNAANALLLHHSWRAMLTVGNNNLEHIVRRAQQGMRDARSVQCMLACWHALAVTNAHSPTHRFGEIGVLTREALEQVRAIPPPAHWPLPPRKHAPRVLLPHAGPGPGERKSGLGVRTD